MRKHEGFVLFVTLVLLTLMTVLLLSLLQTILLYAKASYQLEKSQHSFYEMEALLHQVQMRSFNKACIAPGAGPNDVLNVFKRQKGCHIKHYQYLYEDLGVKPCLTVKGSATHHWRLSIASISSPLQMIQLYIVREAGIMPCEGKTFEMLEGEVSYRYMTA